MKPQVFIKTLRKLYKTQPYSNFLRKILPWKWLIAWETAIYHIDREAALKCVGPGWSSLIHEAYDMIDLHRPFGVSVSQVKEKYGSLRIYINGGGTILFDALDEILNKSTMTCEKCGKPGSTRWDLGWVLTLCDDCIIDKEEKKT